MRVCEMFRLNLGPLHERFLNTVGFEREQVRIPEKPLLSILNRGCGVEIEVENAIGVSGGGYWTTTGDNSLRENGIEYLTRYGWRVGNIKRALECLEEDFDNKRKANKHPLFTFSERTSVHVHLDVRQFTNEQLSNLLVLYTLFEKPLFNYVLRHREHNVFCVPLTESDLMGESNAIWDLVMEWDKYCAVNLKSLRTLGTVEFRHMQGNCDAKYIWEWILLLSLLVRAAERMPSKDLRNMILAIKTQSHYEKLFNDVFRGYAGLLHWHPEIVDSAASDSKLFFNFLKG